MTRLTTEQIHQNEVFTDLDLQHADLSGKEFSGCTFRHVKLQESRWNRARLEDCVFEDCDLTRMNPSQMRAMGVTFRQSKLMGIDWTEVARNPVLSFEECDLRYSSFVGTNLSKAVFRACKAAEANFIQCNLAHADFSQTQLTGANFEDSDLTLANFATADGAFLNPAKNNVKGTRIPVESAVLLALFLGMHVEGYSEEPVPERQSSRRRGRKA
ncbi:pentapeptide repeat-containing protein [Hyalangium versicolor]|uniref:pentapeptide repeat-containing protein n=1 Tax=Hyalangium versicolor TaxID=2861190 RepID=UPI001CCCFBCD|nr:pentapeptide repeat-containing protein [Hyalangium versicolor]